MVVDISLAEFLIETGATYSVTATYQTGKDRQVHCFSFPNGSCIVSPPGRTEQDALKDAVNFVFGQVSLPPEQGNMVPPEDLR